MDGQDQFGEGTLLGNLWCGLFGANPFPQQVRVCNNQFTQRLAIAGNAPQPLHHFIAGTQRHEDFN
jgi:hypothetical protein